jgi:prepilin-type N-terminal cleavage/methylation domain-containing protein
MKKHNGFTLLELLVVITVVALLSVSAVGLFYQTLRSGSKTDNIKELDQNALLAMNVMSQQVRNARKVSAVGAGTCPGVATTLSLTGSDGRTTQFSLSSGKIASNGAEISATSITISNLSFTCARQNGVPDQITISFLAQLLQNGSVVEQKTYTSVVDLRNF